MNEVPLSNLFSVCSSEETAFDSGSSSLIKLNNNTILYLREVNKFLALVCILREENFNRQGVIDYNFICFRDAISEVFELRLKRQKLLENADQDDDELPEDNGITVDCSNHENDVAVGSRTAKITWAHYSSDLKPSVHSYRLFFHISHKHSRKQINYLFYLTLE